LQSALLVAVLLRAARNVTGQDSTAGLEGTQGTLTSWTVCLRDRTQSRESYWHLAGYYEMRTATGQVSTAWRVSTAAQSYFLDCSSEGPDSVNSELLPGPPTYWTVCLSGWSHEILLARAGLCQEGSFGQKPDVQSLEGGRHPIQGRDRLQDCFPRVGCV